MKSSRNENNDFATVLKGSFRGLIFSLVAFAVILLICAIVVTGNDISPSGVQIMALCALGAASFTGAFANRKITKIKGIFAGLLSASEIFIIVFAVSMFGVNGAFTVLTLKKLIIIFIAGIIGGILSANSRKKYK